MADGNVILTEKRRPYNSGQGEESRSCSLSAPDRLTHDAEAILQAIHEQSCRFIRSPAELLRQIRDAPARFTGALFSNEFVCRPQFRSEIRDGDRRVPIGIGK